MFYLRTWLVVCVGLAGFGCGARQRSPGQPTASKKAGLLYAGWYGDTIPTPEFIKSSLAFLETQPFDGLAVYLRKPSLADNLSVGVQSAAPVSYELAMEVLAPMRGLTFASLKNNFALVFGGTPPDFFDDWSNVIANWENLSRACKDSGLKGIMFDNEQYFGPWADRSSASKYAATKSLSDYAAQARLRGRQVMERAVRVFPGVEILSLHGPYISNPAAPAALWFNAGWVDANDLMGPFFEGMLDGAGPASQVIDGGELYHLRTVAEFKASFDWRATRWPRASISFGVYEGPVSAGGIADPLVLEIALVAALRQADRYVWFYPETQTYLLPASAGGGSAAYVAAIRRAKG